MTKSILLYTKDHCSFCKRAKALLTEKGVSFTDIEITGNDVLMAEMVEKSGRHTVPQIFIGETHVGGGSDLDALDAAGGLDPLLEPFLEKV
ncbi:MAG: glutaredoxin 3 [Maricaulaceae bacterium]